MHQALRMLNEHKVATGSAAMALVALLLMLLPRIILTFVLGMIASPILIVVTAVRPWLSLRFHAGSQARRLWLQLVFICRCISFNLSIKWRRHGQKQHQGGCPYRGEVQAKVRLWSTSWTLLSKGLQRYLSLPLSCSSCV